MDRVTRLRPTNEAKLLEHVIAYGPIFLDTKQYTKLNGPVSNAYHFTTRQSNEKSV